jgi:Lrp/AsnC family leucine-responsive transcriptional regulator
MDGLDKRILEELQQDSRNSFTKIAKNIGVSTATVSERVRRLTEKGIIRGYTTILNASEIGMVTLISRVKAKQGYNIGEVGEKIAELEESCCVHQITGDFDLFVISKCTGHGRCGSVIEKLRQLSGVDRVDSELVIKTLKEKLNVRL